MAGQYPDWWKGSKGGSGGGAGNSSGSGGGTNKPAIAASATIENPTEYYAFSASKLAIGGPDMTTSETEPFADSVASAHFFCQREDFTEYSPIHGSSGETASGGSFHIIGKGTVIKHMMFRGEMIEV